MKQVAGTIKMDLAQYREMAAFAQFASDLDPATQKLLARGARLTELLKQAQFSPMPVEEQVISIFAGTRGFLDKLPLNAVNRYEREMLAEVKEKGADIVNAIRTEKAISKDTEAKLLAFLEGFAKSFAA